MPIYCRFGFPMAAYRRVTLLAVPLVLSLTGCGYVHVGRLPEPVATSVGNDSLLKENADLRLEKKILQQELALTRAQGDALRTAIQNRTADGDTTKRLLEKLNETSRELNALRTRYADLQAERAAAAANPTDAVALKNRLGETEEKLASALRATTDLQQEIAELRSEVARTRTENRTLALQVKTVTAQNAQAQAALAQLNQDLIFEKDARLRAEQDAETLRTELKSVAPNSSVLAQLRTGTAADARSLVAHSSPTPQATTHADTSSTPTAAPAKSGVTSIVIRPSGAVNATLVSSLRSTSRNATPRASNTDGGRTHVVAGGDTLAKISTLYYGEPGRWTDILAANRDVLGENNNLVIGRMLRIP